MGLMLITTTKFPNELAMRKFIISASLILLLCSAIHGQDLQEVTIVSSLDQSEQPAFVFIPKEVSEPVPLLVMLHTWSGDYKQKNHINIAVEECRKRNWAMVFPNFRGPNWTPQACGSSLAVQDVVDAVNWMQKESSIDEKKIYLTGVSGGGHMSMLMAGKHPEIWAGVSAWVGISDLSAWHKECQSAGRNYATHIEKVVGGVPGSNVEVDAQLRSRSPINFLQRAKGLPIDLNAGIHDGHTGSVPISHTLIAFNALAKANDQTKQQISSADIREMTQKQTVPDALQFEGESEKRTHEVLLRRNAGSSRVTIFEGGHEGDLPTAIEWLSQQSRSR